MAIENTPIAILIGVAYAVTYFLFYRKNRFFGNIIFMGIGIGILSWDSTTNITTAIGLLLFVGALINTAYDVLSGDHEKSR
jgi:uncharacterized membrane protein YczE